MSTPTITHFGTSRTREAPPLGRVFTYKTLPMKGIDYHPNHIRRLVHAGKFPKPVHLGARKPVLPRALRRLLRREASRADRMASISAVAVMTAAPAARFSPNSQRKRKMTNAK
jgi:hypothetical protein